MRFIRVITNILIASSWLYLYLVIFYAGTVTKLCEYFVEILQQCPKVEAQQSLAYKRILDGVRQLCFYCAYKNVSVKENTTTRGKKFLHQNKSITYTIIDTFILV